LKSSRPGLVGRLSFLGVTQIKTRVMVKGPSRPMILSLGYRDSRWICRPWSLESGVWTLKCQRAEPGDRGADPPVSLRARCASSSTNPVAEYLPTASDGNLEVHDSRWFVSLSMVHAWTLCSTYYMVCAHDQSRIRDSATVTCFRCCLRIF
jgi:hypothetical protein